jgi:RNA polymerase sigma-70 factor (ECF subfamily)
MDRAEDIVQDVFVKLWDMRAEIDTQKNIKALITKMVKNKSLEALRRDQIAQKAFTELKGSHEEVEIPFEPDELDKWLLLDKIYVSMRHLPPKCEEVFRLAKLNGLSYSQIAQELNISIKTVEGHMSKALRIIKDNLTSITQFVFIFTLV